MLLCVSSNHRKSKLPFQTWQQDCYFVFPQTTKRASYHFKLGNKSVTLCFLKPQEGQVTISNMATRLLLCISSNHRKSKLPFQTWQQECYLLFPQTTGRASFASKLRRFTPESRSLLGRFFLTLDCGVKALEPYSASSVSVPTGVPHS